MRLDQVVVTLLGVAAIAGVLWYFLAPAEHGEQRRD